MQGIGKFCFALNILVKIIVLLPIGYSIWEISKMEEFDYILVVILGAMGMLFTGILGLFALLYDRFIWFKFLGLWTAEKHMELHLHKNGVEYGSCTDGFGPDFRSYYFEYNEIEGLEFDPKNHMFRIQGKYRYRMWESANRIHLESDEKNSEKDNLIILEYFQDFERFLEVLQEKSGVNVRYTEIRI